MGRSASRAKLRVKPVRLAGAGGRLQADDEDSMNLLSACRETARRTFRIQSLRPEQESAMLAVLNGGDQRHMARWNFDGLGAHALG
jgi:hypothetical protein